jgi:hypothetical protein
MVRSFFRIRTTLKLVRLTVIFLPVLFISRITFNSVIVEPLSRVGEVDLSGSLPASC